MKSYLCTFVFHPFYNNYSYTNSLFNNFLLFQLNHNFGYIQRKSSHYACLSHIYSSTIIFFFTNLFQPRQGGVLDVLFFFFFFSQQRNHKFPWILEAHESWILFFMANSTTDFPCTCSTNKETLLLLLSMWDICICQYRIWRYCNHV